MQFNKRVKIKPYFGFSPHFLVRGNLKHCNVDMKLLYYQRVSECMYMRLNAEHVAKMTHALDAVKECSCIEEFQLLCTLYPMEAEFFVMAAYCNRRHWLHELAEQDPKALNKAAKDKEFAFMMLYDAAQSKSRK